MIKKIFYFIAIIGWCLSLIVVLLSLAQIDINHYFPYVMLLFVGIFLVWPPAIFKLTRNKDSIQESKSPIGFIRNIFNNSPRWLIIVAVTSFLFANVNGLLFFSSYKGQPDIKGDQYILEEKGTLIGTLTKQEYHYYQTRETLFFIGGALLFYGIAATILYPYPIKTKREEY